jgi:hypothetical protein
MKKMRKMIKTVKTRPKKKRINKRKISIKKGKKIEVSKKRAV